MNFEKPIQEEDVIDVTIESIGAKGDGIAKINNFVIIVPGVQEGEKVKVKITKVLNKMAFGEVVNEGETEETPKEEETETEETPKEEETETEETPKEEETETEETPKEEIII